MDDREQFVLLRTGDLPLAFEGERIAEASSHRHDGPGQNRWHELALYRTAAGRYALAVAYRSCWQGEGDIHWVAYADTPAQVRDALRAYPAVPPGVGYPAGAAYAEKQSRMESDLGRRFAAAVSGLFAAAGAGFVERVD